MKKKLIITIVAILLLWTTFFTTDSIRIKNDKGPIFAIYHDTIRDGGSKHYIGLFYSVYDFHYLNPEANDDWYNEDGTIKDEYKDDLFIENVEIVPWFTGYEKAKLK